MRKIETIKIADFRVDFLSTGTQNWPKIFEQLFARTQNENGVPENWKLLQETIINGGKTEIRRAWRVEIDGAGTLLFKQRIVNRKWNFERWWRGRKVATWRLMRRIEVAREHGFLLPMQIFLCAERRERGFLREEYLIGEWIDAQGELEAFPQHLPELLGNVLWAHKFGICWGGDPNPHNFLIDRAGTIRGVDICPIPATWMERGKDFRKLEKNGLKLPRFFLNLWVVRTQDKIKDFLRKLRNKGHSKVEKNF